MSEHKDQSLKKLFRASAAALVLTCLPQKTDKANLPISPQQLPSAAIVVRPVETPPIVRPQVTIPEVFRLELPQETPITLPILTVLRPISQALAPVTPGADVETPPKGLKKLFEHVHISFDRNENYATNSNVSSFLRSGNFRDAMQPITLNKTGHYAVTKIDVQLTDSTEFSLHFGGSRDTYTVANIYGSLIHSRSQSRASAEVSDAAFLGANGLRDTVAMSGIGGSLGSNFLVSVTKKFDLNDWHLAATALVVAHNGSEKMFHSGLDFQNQRFVGGISFDSQHGFYTGVSAIAENLGYDLVKTSGMGLRLEAEHIHYLGQEPFLPRDTSRIALLLRHEF